MTARKPTELKRLSGTLRSNRANPDEPEVAFALLDPPDHLSDEVKDAWCDLAAVVHELGVLTVTDGLALEAAAGALADLRRARASLERPLGKHNDDGVIVEIAGAGERYYWIAGNTRGGGMTCRPRPELADISDADRRFALYLQKFGLTPADRMKVSVVDKKSEPSPWDIFDQPLEVIDGGRQ